MISDTRDKVVHVDFAGINRAIAEEKAAAKLPTIGVLQCTCGSIAWHLRDDSRVTCTNCFATLGDKLLVDAPPPRPAA